MDEKSPPGDELASPRVVVGLVLLDLVAGPRFLVGGSFFLVGLVLLDLEVQSLEPSRTWQQKG